MKKYIYIVFVLLVLLACSEDTTEYRQQKEALEQANAEKQKQIDEDRKKNAEKQQELEKLKQRLEELERIKNGMVPEPQLLTMEFRRADNPGLDDNVECDVYSSNGVVNCWLSSLEDPKTLVLVLPLKVHW